MIGRSATGLHRLQLAILADRAEPKPTPPKIALA